jgi:UDP-2-acetamido-3-amino-2,3-dideoxy-glucuronate N-acetyltransferase
LKRNIAVIGCGYWGRNLVRNFDELGALHTICDTRSEILQEFALRYPQATIQSSYQQLLHDEEIAAVAISTPAATHYSLTREALLADKDVFVEKPLALKVEEGQELVELARERSRLLMVGHLLEYHPAVIKLKELIDSGELGKIQYIYSNRLNLGKFRTEENILWSFAPHDISVVLLLLGGETPKQVSSHGGNYLHPDIADVTLTTMSFKDGVRAHIFVSWLHPFKEQRLVVVGSQKMAEFDDTEATNKLRLYAHGIEWIDRLPVPRRMEPEVVCISADEPLKNECQDFIDSIGNRSKPRVDGEKGLQVLRVLNACQESLWQDGSVITLDKQNSDYFIHPSSIVEQSAAIGSGTKIWHFSHIMDKAAIGRNCVIGQNVFIASGVIIGDNVKIENNVSVFSGVILEDDVFCGPSCVFTNVVNPRSHVSRREEFKTTTVKRGATIGANATIVCGNTIGSYAFIGAGSVVTMDVPDYALVYGNPARLHGWVCECGEKLTLTRDERYKCSRCSNVYQQQGKELSKVE